MTEDLTVRHRTIDVDGVEIFYREAGKENAPVVLLPHGYPCSSYEFRNFMPALADRWRLLAPTCATCRMPSCICSTMADTGCSKRI